MATGERFAEETQEKPKDIRTYLLAMPNNPKEVIPFPVDWSEDSTDQIAIMFKKESKYLHIEIETVTERLNNFDKSIAKRGKHTKMPLSSRVKRDIERHKKENIKSLNHRLDLLNFKLGVVEGTTIRQITLLSEDGLNINGYKI